MLDDEKEEPTIKDRALAALEALSNVLPTQADLINNQPLPEWLLKPWAARLADLDDPELEQAVEAAERWLSDH